MKSWKNYIKKERNIKTLKKQSFKRKLKKLRKLKMK